MNNIYFSIRASENKVIRIQLVYALKMSHYAMW